MTRKVDLKISCGCGYKTQCSPTKSFNSVLAEALSHSEKTTHTLTINGLVKGQKK